MSSLPSHESINRLVNRVTELMLGLRFSLASLPEESLSMTWRTAILPIPGRRPITIGIASDQQSGIALGAAMFSCAVSSVDASMVDDSLSELANMTAGQIKNEMRLDQALGLPKLLNETQLRLYQGLHVTSLQAGQIVLVVWIEEKLL